MDQRLRKTVANHLNCNDENLVLSPCPTGKHNATYFIDGASRPLVLRLAPSDDPSQMLFYEYRMMRQEPALHNLIRRKTTIQVPEILIADFSHKRLDQDFLLMERLSGKPLSDRTGVNYETVNRIFCDVGQCLKQAHTITGEQYGYVGDHEPMEPQSDWASAFVVMWNKLLDDIEACGGYSNEEADFLRRLLDKHLLLFDRPVPASLLHMDVWGQNIMVGDDGTLTGLLDWDRALWGDPETEFAVLDYCGISEPSFWEGYGQQRDTSPETEIRRVFYFLYELQKYIFIRRVRRGMNHEAEQYRKQSLRLASKLS